MEEKIQGVQRNLDPLFAGVVDVMQSPDFREALAFYRSFLTFTLGSWEESCSSKSM